VETVDFRRELSPAKDLRALWQLYALFRRSNFDVVHTHTPKAGLLGPLAAQLASVPNVVHTVHGFLFHDQLPHWKQSLFWTAEKFTAICADHLLSQSREDFETAEERGVCSASKVHYLGNGIDLELFRRLLDTEDRTATRALLGVPGDAVVVGTVARFVYEKGFAELFAAAERITPHHPNVHFLIIGGRDEDRSDSLATELLERLQRTGPFHFLGWQQELPRWYSAMDLFVLPSHREGVPRACMEAAAMELPVIATDIRGCREIVRDQETGLLIPVRNVDALSHAIESLVIDANLRREMGLRGRQHIAQNFSQGKVLARLLNFYAQIVPLTEDANAACRFPSVDAESFL
jgi:glycosyltransferase involved in cell wall biosynthesis